MKNCRYLSIFIILSLLFFSNTFCFAKTTQSAGKGYVGTLPDLTRNYESKEQTKPKTPSTPAKDFNSENAIKPIPEDDPTFVNIILKPDRTSKYIVELREFIPMLENIFDILDEDNDNVQVFNAKVYFFNKSANYFRDKYANKPESNYVSYQKLMDLNTHARSVALLRSEAVRYNPYLAYENEGSVYHPNNIKQQLDYLKTEIEQIILMIREAR